MVAVVWGGKDGFRKQTQMGFCSKDPQTDSWVRAVGTQGARARGAWRLRGQLLHRGRGGKG